MYVFWFSASLWAQMKCSETKEAQRFLYVKQVLKFPLSPTVCFCMIYHLLRCGTGPNLSYLSHQNITSSYRKWLCTTGFQVGGRKARLI